MSLFKKTFYLFCLCFMMMGIAQAFVQKVIVYKMAPIADDEDTSDVTVRKATLFQPQDFSHITGSLKSNFSVSNEELNCLAEVVYHEAGSETMKGGLAVAEVVLNRREKAGFPKTICGVMNHRYNGNCQFSFVCQGGLQKSKNTAIWQKSLSIARSALNSKRQDISGGALFFHSLGYDPAWTKRLVKTVHIGNHRFYK